MDYKKELLDHDVDVRPVALDEVLVVDPGHHRAEDLHQDEHAPEAEPHGVLLGGVVLVRIDLGPTGMDHAADSEDQQREPLLAAETPPE